MYVKSARFYDRMMSFYDYGRRHADLQTKISALLPNARTLLECACGTGRYLELFARDYEVAGLDIDETMVEISRKRCPQARIVRADMADFKFGRQFDVVACLFRSIGFVKTVKRMRASIANMVRHLNTGGLLLLEPYFTPEQHWHNHLVLNTVEDNEGKLAWMYVQKNVRGKCVSVIHHLVGDTQDVHHFTERDVLGLFTSEEYEAALRDAGVEILDRPSGPGTGVYLCRKLAV